jgi:hypothetical protein
VSKATDALAAPPGGWPMRPREQLPERGALAARLLHLYHIETLLLADLASNATSPTMAAEMEGLADVESHALALLAALRGLHAPAAVRAGLAASQIHGDKQHKADHVADAVATMWSGDHPLERLARGAARAREEIRNRASAGAGRANLHARTAGDPRLRLACACATLMRDIGLAERISGTPNGMLHGLIMACWCNATGAEREPENGGHAVSSYFAERATQAEREMQATGRGNE